MTKLVAKRHGLTQNKYQSPIQFAGAKEMLNDRRTMDRVTGQTLWVRHQVQLCMGHYVAADDDDDKKSAEVARSITRKKFTIISNRMLFR
jgi:hypothetical protein